MYYIIGCGGGGTFLLSILVKTTDPLKIFLVDGDIVEKKNLQRQFFFTEEDIGKNKAEALANKLGCRYEARYIKPNDNLPVNKNDVMFICVDNNPARKNALDIVDRKGGIAIVCGNEYDSAQTYIYKPEWKDTNQDPRVIFPEILTDTRFDPLKPHCTDEYRDNRQLATFNAISATFAMHLLYLWEEKKKLEDNLKSQLFFCNFNKYSSGKLCYSE